MGQVGGAGQGKTVCQSVHMTLSLSGKLAVGRMHMRFGYFGRGTQEENREGLDWWRYRQGTKGPLCKQALEQSNFGYH